ncbi:MAG: DNA polymerase III subunit delta [Muribaculaceae bacterium]|nr:DNA polymerase III subunit delta [Muribaculaceae bacterium]
MKFSDIPCHDSVKQRLRAMVDTGRLPHALLIHGPSGVGKHMMARALVQYIHCTDRTPDGEPCGRCKSCLQHQSFNHIDTLHVFPVVKTDKYKAPVSADFMDEFRQFADANPYMDFDRWATTLGRAVDKKNAQPVIYVYESDALERSLAVTAGRSEFKATIIWLPEKMNEQTANKLLKLIEEPQPGTLFVLVSDDISAILPTIRSRCQPVEMTRLPDSVVAEMLESRLALDPQDAMAQAHIAAGDMNSALRGVDATSASRMFFDLFVRLMRMAYKRDVAALRQWSTYVAALGREAEVRFYAYCTRLIRENFVYNFNIPDISYLNREESQFSRNFARFIHEGNAERIVECMDRAAADIAGNANGKIVNFDFAIKMIILIKN